MIKGGATYQAANDSTHVEDTPEPGKVLSLLILVRVGNHDSALSCPKKSGTDTKPGTSEKIKTFDVLVNRNEQTDGIETVADAPKGQRQSNAESVDKRAAKEAKYGKGAVQSSVLSKSD